MMVLSKIKNPHKVILLSPIIFLFHVLEEFPNLVNWLNSLVVNEIDLSTFLTVNVMGLVITISITLLMYSSRDKFFVFLTLLWLSFLMFANGIFHIAASLIHRSYSPGALTSLLIYIPYFIWFTWLTRKEYNIKAIYLVVVILLGAFPMLLHGYFIIFEGRRLF
jgi:hypothetical protein